jgi:hypothetical protein
MIKNFEEMQKMSKDSMDATMKSVGMFSKATQAIAAEVVDYSKKSFEDGSKVMEKLLGAKRPTTPRPPMKASSPRRPRSASSMPISPRRPISRSNPTCRRPRRRSEVSVA